MFDLRFENDETLLSELKNLLAAERGSTLSILHHLNEIDRRRLHLKEGYSTLYIYCITELGYSESAASRRTRSARALRRFPEVEELLKQRALSLSTLSMLYPLLTADNRDDLLMAARGRSQTEVSALIAKYTDPIHGSLPDKITPIRVLVPKLSPGSSLDNSTKLGSSSLEGEISEKHRIVFAAGTELISKIESAKKLLSGSYPTGVALESLFSEALDLLLSKKSPQSRSARREKRSEHAVKKEQSEQGSVLRRNIPLKTRDEVFLRDRGQCTFVALNGRRCDATWDLEVDHIKPYSLGGDHSVDNLRLLCRAHNIQRGQDPFPSKV